MTRRWITKHLVTAYRLDSTGRKRTVQVLVWGDMVEAVDIGPEETKLELKVRDEEADGGVVYETVEAFVPSSALGDPAENDVLKVNFVDVQQGDGAVIETPGDPGLVVLLDGGDNKLFARYLAARYRRHAPSNKLIVDAMIVSHGDADHFQGLQDIAKSETHAQEVKRLFIFPRRVFHNGLVKGPSALSDVKMLGQTYDPPGPAKRIVTELVDDLLAVPAERMNVPFQEWTDALRHWNDGRPASEQPTAFERLKAGDGAKLDFLRDALVATGKAADVEVLGPIETTVDGRTGLTFLGEPPKGPDRAGHGPFPGHSASHTINGHSILLRLRYGNVRFLFAGDLNEEAQNRILAAGTTIESEVFKVPHHGSADFSPGFLDRVSPVVSIVSSGDESSRKEYIHPRANLMGTLGRSSRTSEPLIFVTELVAFFEMKGWSKVTKTGQNYFGFRRAAFGMVRVRTDGETVLVTTDSAKPELKEAYAFRVAADGAVTPISLETA